MDKVKILVGGSLEGDADAFVNAWHLAEDHEPRAERVLAFESWEGRAAVLTGKLYRMLRHST